jgi:hypothetical protein
MVKRNIIGIAFCITLGFITCTTPLMAQTITVDGYFNQETKKDKAGKVYQYHYIWEDVQSSGFSIFGDAFKAEGAKNLQLLTTAPTLQQLKSTDVYIIVDPDNLKDNPNPNFIKEQDANEIAAWVKAGGVLFILANDSANADLDHLNKLSSKFGITFNKDLILHVTDDKHFSDGALNTEGNPMFKIAKNIFIKDAASIQVGAPAKTVLKDKNGATVIASSKYGKGTVLAIGDPWLYNEYTNGRLPAVYENDKAAHDTAKWLLAQIPKK